MKRRQFLNSVSAIGLTSATPLAGISAERSPQKFTLTAAPSSVNIVGPDFESTAVWAFNDKVPGSEIRVRQGQPVVVKVSNQLQQPTAVHWHGIRLQNAMDGVAGLTQDPIEPGANFEYRFTPPDAGTYWYHSHVNAYEQIGRGLYGPLIVEERNPPRADRELTLMIDDWRLLDDASISDDFGMMHDRSHAGRIGNVPTVNGRFRDLIPVQSGERIRLRIINSANARNFALNFGDLPVQRIAIDGQGVTPETTNEPIIVGASGRVDLMVDFTGEPGSKSPVIDEFYRQHYQLTEFVYLDDTPIRDTPPDWPVRLEPAEIPEPDMANAVERNVVIAGGAMGGLRKAKLNGEWQDLREIARQGYVWAINDTVANKVDMPPLVDVKRGTTVKFALENKTAFPHPMHLHGHHMQLLSIDGNAVSEKTWVDSPLLLPRQRMELAFVADNPGKWLFHCHALEHHSAGLGALVNVT